MKLVRRMSRRRTVLSVIAMYAAVFLSAWAAIPSFRDHNMCSDDGSEYVIASSGQEECAPSSLRRFYTQPGHRIADRFGQYSDTLRRNRLYETAILAVPGLALCLLMIPKAASPAGLWMAITFFAFATVSDIDGALRLVDRLFLIFKPVSDCIFVMIGYAVGKALEAAAKKIKVLVYGR